MALLTIFLRRLFRRLCWLFFCGGFLDNFVYNFLRRLLRQLCWQFFCGGFLDEFVDNFLLRLFRQLCWQFFTALFVYMQYKVRTCIQKSVARFEGGGGVYETGGGGGGVKAILWTACCCQKFEAMEPIKQSYTQDSKLFTIFFS
jgi:hypothetical protein